MKKRTAFISILLALTMILTSCSIKIKGSGDNTSSTESQETVKADEIKLNAEYDLTDDISFKMVKVCKTPVILDTAGSGKGYESYSSSASYIDIIFDITNKSATDFDCNENMNIQVEYDYNYSLHGYDDESSEEIDPVTLDGTFVGENNGWSTMSTFSKAVVPAGETVRVHHFVTYVDMNILSPTYNYLISYGDVNDTENSYPVYTFSYDKSMGTLCDSTEIKLSETFTVENHANITLNEVKFSNKLLPSGFWGSYTYMEIDEYGKTYLIFKFSVENTSEDVIASNASIHGLILDTESFGDPYYISGTILEESDMKTLTRVGEIQAGKKNTVYVLFAVPTEFETANNYEVTFMAGGNFYTYHSENYGADTTSSDESSDVSSY